AEENFKVLMDSAKKDKDQEYYIDAERIRTKMTVFFLNIYVDAYYVKSLTQK
ncbi:unnamed protein product, partial [marine sediment metagenome]